MTETAPPPLTRAELAWYKSHARRIRAELRAENAELAYPAPVCRGCRFPIHSDEFGDIFPRRCTTCEIKKIEELIRRSVHRRGRRRTIKALRRLAK